MRENSKVKMIPTWFEVVTFWSGVRRATDAPQNQDLPNSQEESTSHCLRPFNQFNTLLRKFHVNYWFQSIYIDESIERMIHEMSEIRPLKIIKSITIKSNIKLYIELRPKNQFSSFAMKFHVYL